MSRSRKRSKIIGHTAAHSEKQDKQKANRKLRRKSKEELAKGNILPKLREVSNAWTFAKDGKHYFPGMEEKDMRK